MNVAVSSDVTKVASTTMNSKHAMTELTQPTSVALEIQPSEGIASPSSPCVHELDHSQNDWIDNIIADDDHKRQCECSDSDDDVTYVNKPDPVDGDISLGQFQTPLSFQKVQQLTPGSGIATNNLQMIMNIIRPQNQE